MVIDTEFKSDLASIQQHINDLDSKATTLNDCVSDFSGVRKRVNSAWPSAEIAVMGASGAVAILSAKAAKAEADPKAFLAQKEKEYNELFTTTPLTSKMRATT